MPLVEESVEGLCVHPVWWKGSPLPTIVASIFHAVSPGRNDVAASGAPGRRSGCLHLSALEVRELPRRLNALVMRRGRRTRRDARRDVDLAGTRKHTDGHSLVVHGDGAIRDSLMKASDATREPGLERDDEFIDVAVDPGPGRPSVRCPAWTSLGSSGNRTRSSRPRLRGIRSGRPASARATARSWIDRVECVDDARGSKR